MMFLKDLSAMDPELRILMAMTCNLAEMLDVNDDDEDKLKLLSIFLSDAFRLGMNTAAPLDTPSEITPNQSSS